MADESRLFKLIDRIEVHVSKITESIATLREAGAQREARLAGVEREIGNIRSILTDIETRMRDREVQGDVAQHASDAVATANEARAQAEANANRIRLIFAILAGSGLLGGAGAGVLKLLGGG